MIDETTKLWIRNASDVRAVENGFRFDVLRGGWTVFWIERFCRLYEGEGYAGNPLVLRGCHVCERPELEAIEEFDEERVIRRAALFAGCIEAGHAVDWQYECFMRIFGWVRHNARWGRETRRFRQGGIWIPKKSKKSPSLAAVGLYLLAGDGEPGQSVFFGAKDGRQARGIAGRHAHEMLKQSDELLAECSVNLSTMQFTHEPTSSILLPLSSANERTQQSKQGLNGSLLVDETHVVDRKFMSQIDRMGISRSEPLHLEFSTAGNNPDGYGKDRFDYAVGVLDGTIADDEFFAAVYAAPQDLSDEDLDREPLKYCRMANPAMGHTIDQDEILKDYRRSKSKGMAELAEFKMYRLNIWQHSDNPWLSLFDWDACCEEFDESDLQGEQCWMAWDLAHKSDMSACALAFPQGDTIHLLVYFFMAEEQAQKKSHLASFLEWSHEKHLTLTPGNVIEFAHLKDRARRIFSSFNVQQVIYDPTYAEQLTQEFVEEYGVERLEFRQGMLSFAGPTADFEAMTLSRKLRHNGHPIMRWQIGHAKVRTDVNSNIRPVKPKDKNDHRKIDGVVASIMATAGATRGQSGPPVFRAGDRITL